MRPYKRNYELFKFKKPNGEYQTFEEYLNFEYLDISWVSIRDNENEFHSYYDNPDPNYEYLGVGLPRGYYNWIVTEDNYLYSTCDYRGCTKEFKVKLPEGNWEIRDYFPIVNINYEFIVVIKLRKHK